MIKWLSLAGVVVALDQLTKAWVVNHFYLNESVQVLPFFYWVYWKNYGAAFSMLIGQRWLFIALGIGVTGFIVYELSRLPKTDRVMGWVFGLILGGALGNLVDRIRDGGVVDFIRFEYAGYGFPAFNIADMALFSGAALWIGAMYFSYRRGDSDRSVA